MNSCVQYLSLMKDSKTQVWAGNLQIGALVAATGGRLPPMIVEAACGFTGSGSLRILFCKYKKHHQH